MATVEGFNLNDIRVTGVDGKPGQGTPAIGKVAGLKYFRQFSKNGVTRPAHIEMIITRNHAHYDAKGGKVESSDTMKLEAWNSDSDKGEGRGIADYFAKWYPVGKLFSISNARLRIYKRRVYNSAGAVINNVDGSPILVPATSVVVGSIKQMSMHQESAKTIGREIANYNAGMTEKSFFSRPPQWSNPAHGDSAIWKEIIAYRKAQKYDGSSYYGNAKVCQVSGSTPADGYPAVESANVPAPVAPVVDAGMLAGIMALLTPAQQAIITGQNTPAAPLTQNADTETPF